MSYPPPPPPPGAPGGGQPPAGPPSYGGPPPGFGGGPPQGFGGPPTGGYGAPPPPGYGPGPVGGAPGSSNRALILLMSALVVVVVLVVVGFLVLRARSGGDVELTESQLEDALLTEDDIGDGFEETDSGGGDDDGDDFDRDELDASEECLDLFEEFNEIDQQSGDVPEATISFSDDEDAEIDISLSGPTELTLDDLRTLLDTCDEIEIDDGESTGTIEISELDGVPEVGDDRLGLTLEVTVDEFDLTLESSAVLWTRDGTQAEVTLTGGFDPDTFETSAPDEDLLFDVVEEQDAALADAIDAAR